ncbi:MAG: hypothetical protein WCE30_08360 [Mycobacterium sp.]
MANTDNGRIRVHTPTLRTGAYQFGLAALVSSVLLGIYTALADQPNCAGFYTCTRVTDRTMLLGWTTTAAAVSVFVALFLLRLSHRHVPTWFLWEVRGTLTLGAGALLAGYQLTHFTALRNAMTAIVAASPSMWTASWALWLNVLGLVMIAASLTEKVTRPGRLAIIGACGTTCAAIVIISTLVLTR